LGTLRLLLPENLALNPVYVAASKSYTNVGAATLRWLAIMADTPVILC